MGAQCHVHAIIHSGIACAGGFPNEKIIGRVILKTFGARGMNENTLGMCTFHFGEIEILDFSSLQKYFLGWQNLLKKTPPHLWHVDSLLCVQATFSDEKSSPESFL